MSSRRKRAKTKPKKHLFPFALIVFVVFFFGVIGTAAAGVYGLYQSWLVDLPSIDGIESYNNEQVTRLYANDNVTLLAEIYSRDRTPVTSDQVSMNVFNAIIAVEDQRYYEHNGVDYYGVARAAFYDLTSNNRQGASTITMQLIRQTILQDEANDMSLRRKVREAELALELEERYSKDEILMMYLNGINFGDGCWGIQSAARHYFSKDASELTIAEAALICGIPQSPEYNNPVAYPDNAYSRRNMVLDRMYANDYITEDEYKIARSSDLNLNLTTRTVTGIYLAPYATSFARSELFRLLSDQDLVMNGGLDVYTTIDLNLQALAEEACAWREANFASQYADFEASLVCIDPNNGHILCMRGGKDFYQDQFNTCTQMRRGAGSSFKTFGLVAAIEKGYSPSTIVSAASPVDIGDWHCTNYGGASYGEMSLRQATWYSYNTAYARLVRTIGPAAVAETAHRMGIENKLDAVNSIVLGSNGVNTLEMASAYGTLATGGIHNKPTIILRIVDRESGAEIYHHVPENEQALTPNVAYATTDVLRGVVQYGTGTAARISGRDIAGKTGTSNDWKDSWFVGYTPQLVTAVWVGLRSEPTYMYNNEG
ncbi:MAG: PBP1A family penicillin-binding protein, partial [Coriobacteriia bacterium]|nr:PBP1A family penicillin-binding protein [Coriobacteriia bacterium]